MGKFELMNYPNWAKMPDGYDFSTKGKKWSDYHKYFMLRTDAVWEKTKLKDFFRSFHKFFHFDRDEGKYVWAEPESYVTTIMEPESMEDKSMDYFGRTTTGATNDFQ